MQDKLSATMQIAERTRCDQSYIGRELFGMNDWFADGADDVIYRSGRLEESAPRRECRLRRGCKLVKETLNREP